MEEHEVSPSLSRWADILENEERRIEQEREDYWAAILADVEREERIAAYRRADDDYREQVRHDYRLGAGL